MKQFKAGYIVDAISNLITDNFKSFNYFNEKENYDINKIRGLLQNLSAFDVKFPYTHKIDYKNIHPVLATINNIITRGLPTKAPLLIEEKFVDVNLIKANKEEFEFKYNEPIKNLEYQTIFEILHPIEPGLIFNPENYIGELGSKLEEKFINSNPFVFQLFQAQRDFTSITPKLKGGKSVDFSFTSPYLSWNGKRLVNETTIFEIDGPHHLLEEFVYYDTKRDEAGSESNATTFRFTDNQVNEKAIKYETLFAEDLYEIFKKNFNSNHKDFFEEYSLIYIPFAVARIQKAIIEHFIANQDLLKKPALKIAIIERDLPCGALAINSLKELFANLNALLEDKDKLELPELELSIFENKKWVINPDLHCEYKPKSEDDFRADDFDFIIDHSILRRSEIYKEKEYYTRKSIVIRSSHYYDNSIESSKKIYCANLLKYKELTTKKPNGSYDDKIEFKKYINFFIQNIFRKSEFRPGQLPIISRALQQKPVIGLLPTGGGKSLTYQLPVFLQPGLCLIVDPIKSLMEDQVRVLHNNWIDCCDFVNSNLNREEKQAKFIDFKFGQTQFLFVSPERFVMEEFRNLVQTIDNTENALAFSYCVIDEVHCLSEWGHDFRTVYLMLGKNAQKFLKTKNKKVTLIGLTATASFDVLTDIERELDIKDDDAANAVISIDNTIRKELFYDYVICNPNFSSVSYTGFYIYKSIGKLKQTQLNTYIKNVTSTLEGINNDVVKKSLKQHYEKFEEISKEEIEIENEANIIANLKKAINNFEETPSIIFCPHKSGSLGVTFQAREEEKKFPPETEVLEKLNISKEHKSFFIGSDDDKKLEGVIQKHFQNFLNGNSYYMVSTKAFGMGIDKEDVRLVYHINYSSSPESYIQEAGRAGRDKKKALCVNLINTQQLYCLNPLFINRYSNIEARMKLRHLMETFDVTKLRFDQIKYTSKETLINEIKLIVPDFTETFNIKSKFENDKNGNPKMDSFSTILDYNLDESVHEYFHQNSFKGIETELFQLKRLFTRKEEVMKTVFMQLSQIYNIENDRNIDFYITIEGPFQGNIWLKTEEKIKFGRIINTKGVGNLTVDFNHIKPDGIIDVPLTNNIFDFITTNWKKNSPDTTLFDYLNSPVENIINEGLTLEEYFDKYDNQLEFLVPLDLTNEELANLLIEDFGLMPTTHITTIEDCIECIKKLEKQSNNFKDFIQRIEETWGIAIFNSPKYNDQKSKYQNIYYSKMSAQDVMRVIYRLYSIDFISDYTLDYNKGLAKIFINKKDKDFYFNATEKHLLKYLSKEKTKESIDDLKEICKDKNVFESIKQAVKTNLLFTYSDIAGKRKLAIKDIKEFINESIELNVSNCESFKSENYNKNFKESMYYYFNAKYARSGFVEKSENRSLIDDWKNKIIDDWDIFIKYSKILNSENSFINECKMMRGSCKRIWRSVALEDTKEDYVLNLLYAYASFGLNNPYYFEEAEEYFLIGFENLYLKSNYKNLENKLNGFLEILSKSVKYEYSYEYIRRIKHKLMLKISTINTQNLIKELKNI